MLQIWNHHDRIEIISDKKSFEKVEEEKVALTLSNELIALMLYRTIKGEHLIYDSEKKQNNNIQT